MRDNGSKHVWLPGGKERSIYQGIAFHQNPEKPFLVLHHVFCIPLLAWVVEIRRSWCRSPTINFIFSTRIWSWIISLRLSGFPSISLPISIPIYRASIAYLWTAMHILYMFQFPSIPSYIYWKSSAIWRSYRKLGNFGFFLPLLQCSQSLMLFFVRIDV